LVCLTHSAMFLSVSSPALQSTRITYSKASSSSYFPNCDNHSFIPFETTTTISQKNNLPSSCTTYIKSVSHSIFLLLPLLSYFGCYFSPHRSSERVGLCNTQLVPAAAPISYTRHARREQHLKSRRLLLQSSRAMYWIASTAPSLQVLCNFVSDFRPAKPSLLTYINSAFCPHSVFMCFMCISEQTAIIPDTKLNTRSVTPYNTSCCVINSPENKRPIHSHTLMIFCFSSDYIIRIESVHPRSLTRLKSR
jgi:hypothetical protein